MQDDFFGLLVLLAFIALAWLKQRRSQPGTQKARPEPAPPEAEPPSVLNEGTWGRDGHAADPGRRPREAAPAKTLRERAPAQARKAPARPPRIVPARQAMVALAIYGPCRADQLYPGGAREEALPQRLFSGRPPPPAAAPPSPAPNRPVRR